MPNRPTLPTDYNFKPIQLVPARSARATTVTSSISSATTITLNTLTSLIEVQSLNADTYLKYIFGSGTAVTTSSNGFDEHIPTDNTRHYVLPDGCTAISVIQGAATATLIVIEK